MSPMHWLQNMNEAHDKTSYWHVLQMLMLAALQEVTLASIQHENASFSPTCHSTLIDSIIICGLIC